jgi:hypothetical protein
MLLLIMQTSVTKHRKSTYKHHITSYSRKFQAQRLIQDCEREPSIWLPLREAMELPVAGIQTLHALI